jgi:hypothetical protein
MALRSDNQQFSFLEGPGFSGRQANQLCDFARFHFGIVACLVRIASREKTNFASTFNAERRAASDRRNFALSFLPKSCNPARILPHREGRTRGRHDMRGGDAVAVSGRSVI